MDDTVILKIPCEDASEVLFEHLDSLGLVRPFIARRRTGAPEDPDDYRITEIYRTEESFGSHMLINVCFNMHEPMIGWHDANEDFLLIKDPDKDFKDLYLIIAMGDKDMIQRKIDSRTLSSEDFKIVRMKFNDPFLSFFTMKAQVPHCELIMSEGKAPEFFVTEPSRVGNTLLELRDYKVFGMLEDLDKMEGKK